MDLAKETGDIGKGLSSRIIPNNTTGFNFENTLGQAGKISDIMGSFIPKTNQAPLTTGLDAGYNAVADGVSSIPGIGPILSGAMKVGGLVSDGLSALGVGTDQVTGIDQVMDSKFMKLTPLGLINAFGAKKTDEFNKDTNTEELIGGSYTGTYNQFDNLKAGKKYGLFSNNARKSENSKIGMANYRQNNMKDIASNASDRLFASNNTQQTNYRNMYQLNGGINFSRLGKLGLKIERISDIDKKIKLQQGGTFENYLKSLPKNLQDTTNYRVKLQWELTGKPKNFKEAVAKNLFSWNEQDNLYHGNSVVFNEKENKYEFLKSKKHDTVNLELDWYNSEEGAPFKKDWDLYDDPNSEYYQYVPKTSKFKEGGKMNVIPSGALHAHKHNLGIKDITKKGIPVVSKKEGGITQHAEVEVDEIIFTLEITKKLEELKEKGTEEAMIEAGKLITEEILRNTQDNTGLIDKVQL